MSRLDLGPLVLGGNTFGWTTDEVTSWAVMDRFVADGGRVIDTADSYSFWVDGHHGGESEDIIGRWLRRGGASADVVVTTKVSQHPRFAGLAPETISSALEHSLDRLGVETVGIYYAHFDDRSVPLEETIDAFEQERRAGRIGAVGLSNYSGDRIRAWLEICERRQIRPPQVLQPHYNLLERSVEEEIIPLAVTHDMPVVPYYALAQGLLTGKYASSQRPDGARAARVQPLETTANLAMVDRLEAVARRRGATMAQVALAWLRSRPGVAAPLASVSRPEQLDQLLGHVDVELTPDDRRELE